MKGKYCKLAVGSKSNVVALGTIMPTDGPDAMVHGIPLNGNVRVTIDVAIKGSALLPIPIRDELITISQAIGSYVAWPKEFIIFSSDEVIILLLSIFTIIIMWDLNLTIT